MQVQRTAVRIATGRAAQLDELLDLRVADRQVDCRGAAAQRALADGERQRVLHADEGDDAAGLAVAADRFPDGAQIAPVRTDATAARRQPDVFVPEVDDAVKTSQMHSFRKQEIGRPRSVPPFDSTGVEGMNHSLLI